MTNGQRLYEYKHPPRVAMVPVARRHHATAGDVVMVPVDHTPWRFLTQQCRDSWERSAVGHHLFSQRTT